MASDIPIDDTEPFRPLRQPPSIDNNTGISFDIQWQKLRYNDQHVHGLGYRIRDKRSIQRNQPVSWIWAHGADVVQQTIDGQEIRYFLCRRCHQRSPRLGLFVVNGTDHIRRHLEKRHRQFKDGERPIPSSPANPFSAAAGAVTPRASNLVEPMYERVDERDYQSKLVDWALSQDLTFRQVTHEETRHILAYQQPQLLKILPSSHSTLVDYIKQAYQERQEQLRDTLHAAQSKIHISFDIWASTNGLSLLGVVGHFLDADRQHRTALLGLPRLRGKHSGENIANRLARIIDDYQLSSKLG